MSEADKFKWNQKYVGKLDLSTLPTANERLRELLPLINGRTCLDLACGPGGNSILMAEHGFHVTAWDVSEVAINHLESLARKMEWPILTEVKDLDQPPVEAEGFDLVIDTFYLNRQLFPFIKKVVKPVGLFFMQTFYLDDNGLHRDITPNYKLKPGELKDIFSTWDVLDFLENESTGLQSILVRKPAGK